MNIGRRTFIKTSAGMVGGLMANSMLHKNVLNAEGKKPNILFILTDDHPQWCVGIYGNKDLHTPTIDRLAREGMMFTRAFSGPVCSPSRAMIMTGLHGNQAGIEDWIAKEQVGLAPDKTTIAEVLKSAGYKTGFIGKWHLGSKEQYHPLKRGFDYFMGFLGGGNQPLNPRLIVNGVEQEMKGWLEDILADDAINFIRNNKDNPFLLFLCTRAPHWPNYPAPQEDLAHYKGKHLKMPKVDWYAEVKLYEDYIGYYANISSVDRNLERLLAELKTLGIEENTMVLFAGDNGYHMGYHGLTNKGSAWFIGRDLCRTNMFDTSIVVPLIIRLPALVKPGSVCEELVSFIDFFPTLMEIAGIKQDRNLKLEGESIVPLFKGEKPDGWRDAIFGLYDEHNYTTAHLRMIRTKEWKLILHFEEGGYHELYNLKEDPDELFNVYGKKPFKLIQDNFERRLREWSYRIFSTMDK